MCEYVPGEVLVSFPPSDQIGQAVIHWITEEGREQGFGEFESADEVLTASPKVDGTNALYRVFVDPGSEYWKINRLYNVYLDAYRDAIRRHPASPPAPPLPSETPFCVAPNSLLHADAPPAGGSPKVTLTQVHQRYRELIGLDRPRPPLPTGQGVTVAVLDSGIVDGHGTNVVRLRDFVTPRRLNDPVPEQAVDYDGHGTAVTAIASDIAPEARFVICKVLDDRLRATEFDVLLALRSVPDAKVINLSLQFGFAKGDCDRCGRRSNPSRCMVFEGDLKAVLAQPVGPLVTAAAGNRGAGSLAYPARFRDVVAVASGTSTRRRSSFSNYGALDLDGNEHPYLFFLPGGETEGDEEYVAERNNGDPFAGTSFATAYASAVAALLLSSAPLPRDALLAHLRNAAARYPQGYRRSEHGNGLMRFEPPPGAGGLAPAQRGSSGSRRRGRRRQALGDLE
jgi:hypothetical protein